MITPSTAPKAVALANAALSDDTEDVGNFGPNKHLFKSSGGDYRDSKGADYMLLNNGSNNGNTNASSRFTFYSFMCDVLNFRDIIGTITASEDELKAPLDDV